jgi:hypothetical protein
MSPEGSNIYPDKDDARKLRRAADLLAGRIPEEPPEAVDDLLMTEEERDLAKDRVAEVRGAKIHDGALAELKAIEATEGRGATDDEIIHALAVAKRKNGLKPPYDIATPDDIKAIIAIIRPEGTVE